jgi:hypothetical protein
MQASMFIIGRSSRHDAFRLEQIVMGESTFPVLSIRLLLS